MIIKNLSRLVILLFLFSVKASYSCTQQPDVLIFGTDTFDVYNSPLEEYYEFTSKISEVYGEARYSSCYRNFVATWTIKDSLIYLVNLTLCPDGDLWKNGNPPVIKEIAETFFGQKFHNNLLLIPGLNGSFWCGKGYLGLLDYEKEIRIQIKNSKVFEIKQCLFNACEFGYEGDPNTIEHFIYSRINWEELSLPSDAEVDSNSDKLVFSEMSINVDTMGNFVSFEQSGLEDKRLINELEDIVKSIPCFKVYSYEGIPHKEISLVLFFTEENKKKYCK